MSKVFDLGDISELTRSSEINRDEVMLFFNKKKFKDGKAKKNAEEISETIKYLVAWYFNRKKKDESYVKDIVNLFTNKKFIKAMKIYVSKVATTKKEKKSKDKKYKYPIGLVTLLMDIRAKVFNKINTARSISKDKAEKAQTKRSAIAEADIEKREYSEAVMGDIDDMIHILAKPMTRECIDAGFEEDYAEMLAPAFVSPYFLKKSNVGHYIKRFNNTLMNIQKVGTTLTAEGWTNMIGASLGDPEDGPTSVTALYEEFFKDCEREVFIEGIISMLLEYRNENLINNNNAVAGLNNCINTVILELLEGNGVINYTNGKEKDKKLKLSEKESRKIIRAYVDRRYNAMRDGNDCPRRIVFRTLDAEKYPFITKWYAEYNDEAISDNIDESTHSEENVPVYGSNNNQNRNGNNQQFRNNNNNQRR